MSNLLKVCFNLFCSSSDRAPGNSLPYNYEVYGNCSKISNTFLYLFPKKMLVIRTEFYKMLANKANREDTDQNASSENSDLGLPCLSVPFWQATSV